MTNKLIQLDQTNQLKGFENIDLSNGYACDMVTGICGPLNELNDKKIEEENKNENNSMV